MRLVFILLFMLAACQALPTPTALPPATPAPLAAASTTPATLIDTPVGLPATRSPRQVAGAATATLTLTMPVTTAAPTFTPSPTPTPAGIVVELGNGRDGLRLRAAPDTLSPMLAPLDRSMTLSLIGKTSDNVWLQVRTPQGETGWVMVYFLDLPIDVAQLALPQVAAAPTLTPVIVTPPAPPDALARIRNLSPTVTTIYLQGQALGSRADVFSKVGDSLTVSTYFLYPIGWGGYNLRDYAYLAPTVERFSAATARTGNAFFNHSLAADNGWTSGEVLDPARANRELCGVGETPLVCEYRLVRPAFALILFGTNDVASLTLDQFRANMRVVLDTSIRMGVVPLVSTMPARRGFEREAQAFNAALVALSDEYGVPLWDYGAAMAALPNGGLSEDGVHPSFNPVSFDAAADFTPANLRYGFTVRNLLALQILDAVWRYVS